MKTSGAPAGDAVGQPGEQSPGMENPPPGGTPPPATVAGLKSLFGDSTADSTFPESGPGVLQGRVRDDVSQAPVLAGLEVSLAVIHGNKVVSEKQVETDQAGAFAFRDLVTDPSVKYAVAVVYQGVRYAPDVVTFPEGKAEATVEIPVYPSGPAPGKARVKGSHVILAGMGDTVQVTEMIFVDNPEQKALIGSPEGVVTFELQLPKTASNLSVDQGLQRDHISVGDGMLYYDGPLYPGTNQVVLSYQVKPATGWTFRRRMNMPVDMFDVFVKESALRVKSQVLGPGERLDMRGTPFLRYHGGPFEAGAVLSFTLAKASGAPATASGAGGVSAVPIAVMVALFVSFFVALPLLRPAGTPSIERETSEASLRRELEAERDRLLLAVADLDQDFQAGKLSEEDYQALRDRYKSAAMTVMRRLDLVAPGTPSGDEAATPADLESAPGAGLRSTSSESGAGQDGGARMPAPTASQAEARFCTQCGRRLDPQDRFCARCGTRVNRENG